VCACSLLLLGGETSHGCGMWSKALLLMLILIGGNSGMDDVANLKI
jgi:hypothetical protein